MIRLLGLIFLLLLGGSAIAQPVPPTGCTTTTCTGSVLPLGYLTVAGNQFQSGPGNNVRLACAVYRGTGSVADFKTIAAGGMGAGFNCVRIDWRDAYLSAASPPAGCNSLTQIQTCVANAKTAGLAVIFSHLGNEIPAAGSSCVFRQANGLWFDNDPSIGVVDDGCGNGGNYTYTAFKADTVDLLQRYAGNSTVIGYEFHSEPIVLANSGGGGSGKFTVSGGKLLGPNGSPVNLLGIDLYTDTGFAGGGAGAAFELPVIMSDTTSCYPLLRNVGNTAGGFYPKLAFVRFQAGVLNTGALPTAAQLQPYINCLTSKNIVVAVDYHLFGGVLGPTPDSEGQTLQSVATWYNSLAQANASNPYFWVMTQNEPCGQVGLSCAPGFNTMIRVLYDAIRNKWDTSVPYAANDKRNNGGNYYIQTVASCTSSSSGTGPSGTGSGISDGTCSWNFVSSAVTGNTAPILVTESGGFVMSGWLNESTIQNMTNIVFDFHAYPWQYCPGGGSCSSDPGTAVTDANLTNRAVNDTAGFTSADGVVPIFGGESGNNTSCSGSPDPSYPSLFNSDANAPTRVSSRFVGVGYFYHNWSANTCGFTQGNFVADSPVSLTASGTTVAGFIAAGNGPVPLGGSGTPAVNWAGGGDTDIQAACSDVGTAVNAVNPGTIEFCPGPINNSATLLNGAAKP